MIRVVLVSPEGEENIGSIARVMMNFNVKDLTIVAPACNPLSPHARRYAVHSESILENARIVPNFQEALRDCQVSVAFSRREGQWRRQDYILPELPKVIKRHDTGIIALVFGREKTGLTTEEIQDCDLFCTIPTSPEHPSLNLAQSVGVALYQLTSGFALDKKKGNIPPAREKFLAVIETLRRVMDKLGYFQAHPRSILMNYFRKIFTKAQLTAHDLIILQNVFTRMEGMVESMRKKIPPEELVRKGKKSDKKS